MIRIALFLGTNIAILVVLGIAMSIFSALKGILDKQGLIRLIFSTFYIIYYRFTGSYYFVDDI